MPLCAKPREGRAQPAKREQEEEYIWAVSSCKGPSERKIKKEIDMFQVCMAITQVNAKSSLFHFSLESESNGLEN